MLPKAIRSFWTLPSDVFIPITTHIANRQISHSNPWILFRIDIEASKTQFIGCHAFSNWEPLQHKNYLHDELRMLRALQNETTPHFCLIPQNEAKASHQRHSIPHAPNRTAVLNHLQHKAECFAVCFDPVATRVNEHLCIRHGKDTAGKPSSMTVAHSNCYKWLATMYSCFVK